MYIKITGLSPKWPVFIFKVHSRSIKNSVFVKKSVMFDFNRGGIYMMGEVFYTAGIKASGETGLPPEAVNKRSHAFQLSTFPVYFLQVLRLQTLSVGRE